MGKTTKQKVIETAKKTASKTTSVIKSNPTIISNALLVLVVGIGGYYAYGAIKKLFTGDANIDNNVNIDVTPNPILTTITESQAAIFAQQLLDAMNVKQPFWGTDEATILGIFQQINADDFKLVFNAFGMKDYNGYNSPPTGFWSNLDSYEKRNLVYWLQQELSSSDGEVYHLVKELAEQAGFIF